MPILSDIWNYIKQNTLDKTNLDEQLIGGIKSVFNPAPPVSQINTSTIPQFRPQPAPTSPVVPNISVPKPPTSDVENRINLLKEKLMTPVNSGLNTLKEVFKVDPSKYNVTNPDTSLGGQVLNNIKNIGIKNNIIPTKQYTSGGGSYSGQGIDLEKILNNTVNAGLKVIPNVGPLSQMTGQEPLDMLGKVSGSISSNLSKVNPFLGGAYEMGTNVIPPVFAYNVAKQVANLPGETSAIMSNPNLNAGQKLLEFGGREVLPLAMYKLAPEVMRRLIPIQTYNALTGVIGKEIQQPSVIKLLTQAAERGAGTMGLINIANQIKLGMEKGMSASDVAMNILTSTPEALLGGGIFGAASETPGILMRNRGQVIQPQNNSIIPQSKPPEQPASPQTRSLDMVMSKLSKLANEPAVQPKPAVVPNIIPYTENAPVKPQKNGVLEDMLAKGKPTPKPVVKPQGNLADILSNMQKEGKLGQTLKPQSEFNVPMPIADWNKVRLSKNLDLKQGALMRDIATAMSKSGGNFNLDKATTALSHFIKRIPESEYKGIRQKADFSVRGNMQPFWDHLEGLAKKYNLPSYEKDWQEANRTLMQTEPAISFKPKSTKLSDIVGTKKTAVAPSLKPQPVIDSITSSNTISQVQKPLDQVLTKPPEKTVKASPEVIQKAADDLNVFKPKAKIMDKSQASSEIQRALSHHKQVGQHILDLAKENGIKKEDLTDVLQGIKPAPKGFEDTIKAVRRYTDNLRTFRENPTLGYQENYLQHIKKDELAEAVNKIYLDSNLWLPENVLDLGSTKTRKGTLDTTHLKDFDYVWNRMGQEAAYDKYKDSLHNSKPKVDFINKVKDHIKPDEKGDVKPPSSDFNYIDESAKANEVVNRKKIKANIIKGVETYNVLFDNIKREDAKLAGTMRDVRDAWREYMFNVTNVDKMSGDDFANMIVSELGFSKSKISIISDIFNKQKTPEAKQLLAESLLKGTIKKKIQTFIDTVGEYEFEPNTKKFLNEQIDRLIKVNQYTNSIYDKAVNLATGVTYRAQIWGNIAVALQQGTEGFRVPAIYGADTTVKATKQLAADKLKGRNIVKDYQFDQNDFSKIQDMFSGAKKSENILTKIDEKVGKVGNFMVTVMEDSKNAFFLTAAEIAGKEKGLTGKALRDFVRDELFTNGYILDKFNTPEIFQKSATARLALQYQQYMMKDYRRIIDSYVMDKDASLTFKLLAAKLVQILFWAGITGAGWEAVKRGTVGIGFSFGPVLTAFYEAGKIINNIEAEKRKEKEDPEYKGDYADIYGPKALGDIFKRNVVPFGAQYMKTSKSLENLNRGYAQTAGGRITYKTSDNPIVKAQSLVFGPSVDKESRKYYKKEGGILAEVGITEGKPRYTSINETRSNYIKKLFEEGKIEEGRKAIDDEHITQDIRRQTMDSLTESEKKKLSEFYPTQKRDSQGIVIPNYDTQAQAAHAKWNNPEIIAKLTEQEKRTSRETGKPLNPFYALSPEQQQTILRIQTLPPGNKDKKDLTNLNIEWLSEYWADQQKYDKDTKAIGLRSENPYYDASRIKISPELQTLLDVYNTLPKGTGARSNFLKAYPSVLEYFNANEELTNAKRLVLGLPPVESSTGKSGSNFNYKLYYALKDVMNSYTDKQSLNKSLASLMAKKPKVKSIIDEVTKTKKINIYRPLDDIMKEYQTKLFGKKSL